MRISGGVKVSAHIPAAASDVQQAVTARALNSPSCSLSDMGGDSTDPG